MPMYEYHCTKCDKEFEELVFKDGEEVRCPACGSVETEKLLSCCRFKNAGSDTPPAAMRSSGGGGGGCSGCSGGNCSTCG